MRVLLHDSLAVLWDVGRNRCPRRGNFLQYLTLQMVLTVGCCWFGSRKWEHRSATGCTSDSISGSLIWQPLSRKKTKNEIVSSTAEKRSWQTGYIAYDLWRKKTANMEVIAENTLRNSYEKRLKKYQIRFVFICFLGAWRWRTVACAEENAPGSTRIIQKGRTITHQTRDSNIKVIYWFKMNLQQYVKTFLLKGDRCAEESAGIFI